MTLNRKVVKIILKDVNDMAVEEIIDSFPDEKIKEAVKNVYDAAYKKRFYDWSILNFYNCIEEA